MEIIKAQHLPLVQNQSIISQNYEKFDQSEGYPLAAEAFLNKILQIQDQFEDSSLTFNKKRKSNTRQIQRKRRKNSLQGKWTTINKLNYYKSILKFLTENPHFKVSWKYWKPEKFYPKMVEQINKGQFLFRKNVIQCKSFDQRQRKEHFDGLMKLDMIELSILKLRHAQEEDKESKIILENYFKKSEEKSKHMKLVQINLQRFKQQKHELDDLLEFFTDDKQNYRHTNASNSSLENCFYF